MSVHGNIIIFPTSGEPPSEPWRMVKELAQVLEDLALVMPGTAAGLRFSADGSATFGSFREDESFFEPGEYAYARIAPERLTKALSALVYIHDVNDDGNAGPILAPSIHLTVLGRRVELFDSYTDELVAETWGAVEFDFEFLRFDEEIHRIRDPEHRLFTGLSNAFESPVACDLYMH